MLDVQQPISKLQSIRTILEVLIVTALIWTGSSLIELKTQTAIVQTQLAALRVDLADLPATRIESTRLRSELEQTKRDIDRNSINILELQKIRGLR